MQKNLGIQSFSLFCCALQELWGFHWTPPTNSSERKIFKNTSIWLRKCSMFSLQFFIELSLVIYGFVERSLLYKTTQENFHFVLKINCKPKNTTIFRCHFSIFTKQRFFSNLKISSLFLLAPEVWQQFRIEQITGYKMNVKRFILNCQQVLIF